MESNVTQIHSAGRRGSNSAASAPVPVLRPRRHGMDYMLFLTVVAICAFGIVTTDSLISCAVELVLNGLTDRELRNSLPRNFTGIRKAICYLQNGSVSENAPGYHKAYAAELAMAAVELGWYKLRFPEEFERACRCTYENFERKAVMQ